MSPTRYGRALTPENALLMNAAFAEMPDAARLWVFGTRQRLLGTDAQWLLRAVAAFVHGWAAHGERVLGAYDWRYDHFLMLAADESQVGVSGCSIDTIFHLLHDAERQLGLTFLDSSPVWYRDRTGAIESVDRLEFRARIARGEVDEWTSVFDNTVGQVGQLRRGEWERPLHQSWHGRAFLARR